VELIMSMFAQVASEVMAAIDKHNSKSGPILSTAASEVLDNLGESRVAVVDKDAEWQRVHSYLADVLKDTHVLYAKLARLQGDFTGAERDNLEQISERVLDIGENLSQFSREFKEGRFSMVEKGFSYGDPGGMAPQGEGPPPSPPTGEEELMLEETEEIYPGAEEEPGIPVVVEEEGEEEEK
jgi:hypothetical protein